MTKNLIDTIKLPFVNHTWNLEKTPHCNHIETQPKNQKISTENTTKKKTQKILVSKTQKTHSNKTCIC